MRIQTVLVVAAVSLGLGLMACTSTPPEPTQTDGLQTYSQRVSQSEADSVVKNFDNPTGSGCYRRACSIDRCYPDGTCDVTLSIPPCGPCVPACTHPSVGDQNFCSAMGCGGDDDDQP